MQSIKYCETSKLTDTTYVVKAALPCRFAKPRVGQFLIVATQNTERIPVTPLWLEEAEGKIHFIVEVVGASTYQFIEDLKNGLSITSLMKAGKPNNLHGKILFIVSPIAVGVASYAIQNSDIKDYYLVVASRSEKYRSIYSYLTNFISENKSFFHCDQDRNLSKTLGELKDTISFSPDIVMLAGSPSMMRFSFETLKTVFPNSKFVASLNPIMLDGTGMCGACRVEVAGEVKFACKDGPDFLAEDINWDNLIERQKFYTSEEEEAKRQLILEN